MALIKVLIEVDRLIWNKFKALAIDRGYKVSSGYNSACMKVFKDELDAHDRL